MWPVEQDRYISNDHPFLMCLNWAIEMCKMHKEIYRGLVLQEGTEELEE